MLWFFLSFREKIIGLYDGLFTEASSGAGQVATAEQGFGKKWGWYQSIYGLAQGDVRRISEVTKLPLQQCLIWLEFEKEKNKLEADAIKRAYKS